MAISTTVLIVGTFWRHNLTMIICLRASILHKHDWWSELGFIVAHISESPVTTLILGNTVGATLASVERAWGEASLRHIKISFKEVSLIWFENRGWSDVAST